MHSSLRTCAQPRRAVILLVVILFLALFAAVALTFVLYAESEAIAARLRKEAEAPHAADAEPELLLSYFLQQLIYDVPDARSGVDSVNSALRGHSLMRTLTGYNTTTGARNDQFYNGIGRIRSRQIPFSGSVNDAPLDEYHLVNYMQFPGDLVHDPERPGWRSLDQPPLPYAGGFNAPYTYPDLNSMVLAAQRPADGAVLVPSFHRPWLFGHLSRGNPNWQNDYGKYLLLRPRPQDNARDPVTGQPLFPYPDDEGGDVKNLMGAPGYFDGQHFHNN